MKEPTWLTRSALDAIQADQCFQHGGSTGPLNEGLVESALARPRHQYAYAEADLYACAAAYVFGIAKNHGYQDANKRTAFIAGVVFLRMNGVRIVAEPRDVIGLMLAVATDVFDEAGIAAWLRAHTVA